MQGLFGITKFAPRLGLKMKIFLKITFFLFVLSCDVQERKKSKTQEVQVVRLAKTVQSWDNNMLPKYPQGQPEVTVLKITIPPHTALPMHKHPFINVGVVTKGKLTVTTKKGEKLYLEQGQCVVEVVSKWHYGKNESDLPCEVIVFYAGIQRKEVTIKEKK